MPIRVQTLFVVIATAALTACSSLVKFESQPAGAQVSYQGKVIGVTPFESMVKDQFGFFSQYDFTATKEGYAPQTLSFKERSPLDAQGIVPGVVKFELKK